MFHVAYIRHVAYSIQLGTTFLIVKKNKEAKNKVK